MAAPPTIPTERLLLRRSRIPDAVAIFEEYAQDVEVARYLTWRPHAEIADSQRFLERCAARWTSGAEFSWVLTRRGLDRPIGMVACRIRAHAADIGYVLTRHLWGQGLTTEAVRAVVDWASGLAPIFRVWAVCDVENPASARVLEKVGMLREGTLRRWIIHPNLSSDPRDCHVYSRTRAGA